jgi:hypothetical protein
VFSDRPRRRGGRHARRRVADHAVRVVARSTAHRRTGAYYPDVIYELREYTTVPGRLPALVKRFNEHTLGIFARLGMEVVFMSLTELGEDSSNELVYVMRFDSYDDMAAKWAAFRADPEWNEVRKASEADGPIVAKVSRRVLNPALFNG